MKADFLGFYRLALRGAGINALNGAARPVFRRSTCLDFHKCSISTAEENCKTERAGCGLLRLKLKLVQPGEVTWMLS
jgi:hypothetical protein